MKKSKVSSKKLKPKVVHKAKAPVKLKKQKETKPAKAEKRPAPVESDLPKQLKLSKDDAGKYKKLLLDLRDHLIDGVNFLATDNLKRSTRESSGELSGYSMHMADAGTDNFDREFALSLVSNEQEALYEIDEALKRIESGVYGLCAMCEKPIRRERLEAVPFARMCVVCQSEMEKERRRPTQATTVFSESAEDEVEQTDDTKE